MKCSHNHFVINRKVEFSCILSIFFPLPHHVGVFYAVAPSEYGHNNFFCSEHGRAIFWANYCYSALVFSCQILSFGYEYAHTFLCAVIMPLMMIFKGYRFQPLFIFSPFLANGQLGIRRMYIEQVILVVRDFRMTLKPILYNPLRVNRVVIVRVYFHYLFF